MFSLTNCPKQLFNFPNKWISVSIASYACHSNAPSMTEYWGRRNAYKLGCKVTPLPRWNMDPLIGPFVWALHHTELGQKVLVENESLCKIQLLYFGWKLTVALNNLVFCSLQKWDHNYLWDYRAIFCPVLRGCCQGANEENRKYWLMLFIFRIFLVEFILIQQLSWFIKNGSNI